MSVLSFDADDLFVIRITKALTSNPDNAWANSYEFRAVVAGDEGDLLALGIALVDFEAELHYDNTTFLRLLISTWAPDSVPYDPTTFIASSLTAAGTITSSSNPLALDQALSVTRQASSGRFGHLYLRNVTEEAEVSAPAGKLVLNNRPNKQTALDGAIATAGLDAYIGVGAAGLQMVMVNKLGTSVRAVTQLFVQGMASVKTDHRWFNRTSP